MWRSERFDDEQVEGQNKSQYNSLELGSAGKGREPDKKAEAEVPPCQHLELMRSVSQASRETACCCHCCSSEPTSHYFKKLEQNSCSFPFGVFNKVSSVLFWEGFFAVVTKYPFSSPPNLNQNNLLSILLYGALYPRFLCGLRWYALVHFNLWSFVKRGLF